MEIPAATIPQLRSLPRAGSPQMLARFAGVLYLLIAVFAGIAHFYVPGELLVPGDAAATAQRIAAGVPLFRLAIGSEIVILLAEVVLSLVLFVLFKPVNATLSLVAAVFRLVMTTIHGFNLVNYYLVLAVLDGTTLAAFDPAQRHALVQFFLDAHSFGFTLGIVFLVPHVFLLAYLILRSQFLPVLFGILFLIAGCGYMFDTAALLFVASYRETPAFIALPIAIAEIAFPLWLLVRGVRRTAFTTA